MSKVLIVYGTGDGQTAKIASRLGDVIANAGFDVELADARGESPSLSGVSAVLVGGSLRYGHFQREIEAWARQNRHALGSLPSAFFAVSLSAARTNVRAQREVIHSMERFADVTRWTPLQQVPFAGALAWSRYGFFTKLLMLMLMKLVGGETDTSRDYEYTDWAAVETFARDFAESLQPIEVRSAWTAPGVHAGSDATH